MLSKHIFLIIPKLYVSLNELVFPVTHPGVTDYLEVRFLSKINTTVDWKNTHSLKVEDYVLFGRLAEDLSLRGSLSDSSEGLLQIAKEGARIYREFCLKK